MFGNTEAQGGSKQDSMAVENKERASHILELKVIQQRKS